MRVRKPQDQGMASASACQSSMLAKIVANPGDFKLSSTARNAKIPGILINSAYCKWFTMKDWVKQPNSWNHSVYNLPADRNI